MASGSLLPVPLEDVAVGAHFLSALPRLLRHRCTFEQARAAQRRRLEHREADFLALVQRAVYQHPASPYRRLLDLAGCEYGDLERLVRQDGLEGALGRLFRQGVYLSLDEFKGRRPTIRGSAKLDVEPTQVRMPGTTVHLPTSSSRSRGRATPVPVDLGFVRDRAVNTCLGLHARGGLGWLHASWGVPGSFTIVQLLEFTAAGARADRWFSQVDPAAAGTHPRYRWSARVMRWQSRLLGVRLPAPRYVPTERPEPILRWLTDVLRAGGTPHLLTFASSAVRLSRAAAERGIDLQGAQITMTGEPITAARLAAVRRSGAAPSPRYGIAECGTVGYGCLAPEAPDDLHLLNDLHALAQVDADSPAPGVPAGALLMSSLRATAPLMLLNLSLGDRAVVSRRACGCPLDQLGWNVHLHTVRSFEKLTAGGMTFLDTDVVQVLEEVLPARFGGGPTDYQLLEDEGGDGEPRLRLLVRPTLGPLDQQAVADTFLDTIGTGSGAERVMALQWRAAGLLRVERRPPLETAAGKILHLHRVASDPAARVTESESPDLAGRPPVSSGV